MQLVGSLPSIGVMVQTKNAQFEVQDILRDGLQTKISFCVHNIETDQFVPEFILRDNSGNTYTKNVTEFRHDKEQKTVSGVVAFEPIESETNALELSLREGTTGLEWKAQFAVDPKKVGPKGQQHLIQGRANVGNQSVEIVKVLTTPMEPKYTWNLTPGCGLAK